MSRLSRSARSALAVLTVLTTAVLGASSASAAPRQPIVYDALGDSFASGYGVPPYSACGRSDSAYAVQLNGREKVSLDNFVACAGATTATLVSGGQLAALDANTDLVTISIGGNDIHWSQAVTACLGGTALQCSTAIAGTRALITGTLPGLLNSLYTQIGNDAPNAHVLVTGYPRLFSPAYGSFLNASVDEQQALNDGADLLNGVIAAAVTRASEDRAAAGRPAFKFVDVTKRFIDHGVNAPDPWVNGPFDPAGAFHPNTEGYEAYTAAVTAAVNPSQFR